MRPSRVSVTIERNAGDGADFLERAVVLIAENKVLHRVVGHDDINPASPSDQSERFRATWLPGRPVAGLVIWMPLAFENVGEMPLPSLW